MSIHHEITIHSSEENIYKALTNSEQSSELTETTSKINAEPGRKFSCFDGIITGITVGNWDDGIYAILKVELKAVNEIDTTLIFDHTGYPMGMKLILMRIRTIATEIRLKLL